MNRIKYQNLRTRSPLALLCLLLGAVSCSLGIAASTAARAEGSVAAPAPAAPLASTAPSVDQDGTSLSDVSPNSIVYGPGDYTGSYVLGPGDSIAVRVMPQDKYSDPTVPITQDGTLFYPKIGVVDASGKTIDQLTSELTEKLSEYCINPNVTVSLLSIHPQLVYVSGGVLAPKVLDVHAASNVVKAITLAGGPTDKYELSHVTVLRGNQVLTANVYDLMVNGVDNGQNLSLKPGDLVIVPINTARITVLGAVAKPGTYPLDKTGVSPEGPMRLSDALALAGGADKGGAARIGKVGVIQPSPDGGKPVETNYDYGRYLAKGDMSQNPLVADNDVIVVPDPKRNMDIGSILNYITLGLVLRGM